MERSNFLNFVVLLVAVFAFLSKSSLVSAQLYKGTIVGVDCDPKLNFGQQTQLSDGTFRKGCEELGIGIEDFGIDVELTDGLAIDVSGTVKVGEPFEPPFVIKRITAEREGNLICLYHSLRSGLFKQKVKNKTIDIYDNNIEDGINTGLVGASPHVISGKTTIPDYPYPGHCVLAPPEYVPVSTINWGDNISKTCTHYCDACDKRCGVGTSSDPEKVSLYQECVRNSCGSDPAGTRYCASKNSNPFISVIVQCVQETLNNLTFATDVNGESSFSGIQEDLRVSIRALLILYIIFVGLDIIMQKRRLNLNKSSDVYWIFLKFAFVMYFATGDGVVEFLLPGIFDLVNGISIIIIEATLGDTNSLVAANQALQIAVENANNQVATANIDSLDFEGVILENDDVKEALLEVQKYGYNFCDFRNETYPNGLEYLRMWDTVDCKLAKYYGIGDNQYNSSLPQILIIAVSSLVSTGYGIPIFILSIIYMVFIFLVVLRVVEIYIISLVALTILIFISPLFIPAILFNFTKGYFDKWLKQVISYSVQPIIILAFFVFVLSLFDFAIFEDNYLFSPRAGDFDVNADGTIDNNEGQGNHNKIMDIFTNQVITPNQGECYDEDAMACVYQKVSFQASKVNNLGDAFNFIRIDITNEQAKDITSDLLQLVLLCFIIHAGMTSVESMSTRLTNAAAGGASGLASSRVYSPLEILDNSAIYNEAKIASTGRVGSTLGQVWSDATLPLKAIRNGLNDDLFERKTTKLKKELKDEDEI